MGLIGGDLLSICTCVADSLASTPGVYLPTRPRIAHHPNKAIGDPSDGDPLHSHRWITGKPITRTGGCLALGQNGGGNRVGREYGDPISSQKR
jgi:hypothetical protein